MTTITKRPNKGGTRDQAMVNRSGSWPRAARVPNVISGHVLTNAHLLKAQSRISDIIDHCGRLWVAPADPTSPSSPFRIFVRPIGWALPLNFLVVGRRPAGAAYFVWPVPQALMWGCARRRTLARFSSNVAGRGRCANSEGAGVCGYRAEAVAPPRRVRRGAVRVNPPTQRET